MQIIEMETKALRPYAHNPRDNDKAVEYVANSIRQFGFKVPIVIDRNWEIICGHTRWKAAKVLGLDTVPCVMADDLTPEQVKAFRLADNKVSEIAGWNFDLLELEFNDIDPDLFDMADFGFFQNHEWFESGDKGEAEEGEDEYKDFLEKFEEKHTTDDCYTPEPVYQAVAAWVAAEYGLNPSNFVRPFYPGGDYQKEVYSKNAVVVDNPPFSILAEIIRFYVGKGVKFFLFCPALTAFQSKGDAVTSICAHATIVYENKASVRTSFITNLDNCRARTAPALTATVEAASDEYQKTLKVHMPKYIFPDHVMTSATLGKYSGYGIDFRIPYEESTFISGLDAMKDKDKDGIFGGGLLLSDRLANEAERARAEAERARAEAERARAEVWTLSGRELEIVKGLNQSTE